MKRHLAGALLSVLVLSAASVLTAAAAATNQPEAAAPARATLPAAKSEVAATPALDDPDHLLTTADALALKQRLEDFAHASGHRVLLRLVAHAPADTDGRKINAHVEALAGSLGLAKDGVLVFYSADRDEWKLWLGDALLPAVMGRPGTAADFTPDGTLHTRKDELLAPAAKISGDKTKPADRHLIAACGALLDSLLPALNRK